MKIIGAGMSGLLAGKFFRPSIILERQESLPNNHSALLRFRTDEISKLTGIPFRKVLVRKAVLNENNHLKDTASLRDSNVYSLKVTGVVSDRSILNLAPGERWIAPSDFISQLAECQDIRFGTQAEDLSEFKEATISTIPMPALMRILDYKYKEVFNHRPIWTITCYLRGVDVYQTIYLPYVEEMPYRVTVTKNKMTLEFSSYPANEIIPVIMSDIDEILFDGNRVPRNVTYEVKKQDYGKIVPISEDARQAFIIWATDNYNIFSLGRFAVWRPILLDDLVQDLQRVASFIRMRSRYQRHKEGIRT